MQTVLLLITFQSNYFKKGSHRIKGAKQSAKAAAKALAYFRENELPIVHILQTGKMENLSAEILQPYELLEPREDESILVGSELNAFADNKLQEKLQNIGAEQLVIAGITAEKQVLATVLAAKVLNYPITILQDACAASTLKLNGEKIKADLVHQVIMATLGDLEVEICSVKAFIKNELKIKKKQLKATAKQEAIMEAAKAALEAAPESEPAVATTSLSKHSKNKTAGKSKAETTGKSFKDARVKEKTT